MAIIGPLLANALNSLLNRDLRAYIRTLRRHRRRTRKFLRIGLEEINRSRRGTITETEGPVYRGYAGKDDERGNF